MEALKFDIEAREVMFSNPPHFIFTPLTSAGQDWLEDELELHGTGRPVQRMVVAGVNQRDSVVQRMRRDGLQVATLYATS